MDPDDVNDFLKKVDDVRSLGCFPRSYSSHWSVIAGGQTVERVT